MASKITRGVPFFISCPAVTLTLTNVPGIGAMILFGSERSARPFLPLS